MYGMRETGYGNEKISGKEFSRKDRIIIITNNKKTLAQAGRL
jgi:hypothetical protein